MRVVYTQSLHMPVLMELSLDLQQPDSEQARDMLGRQGYDLEKMGREKKGRRILMMKETASIRFETIGVDKEKAVQMPLWTDKIAYEGGSGIFSGKGACEGYRIIKTF
jgi:hypothetical protein